MDGVVFLEHELLNDATEMNMAIAGLLPNTLYSVDVVIFGKAIGVGGSTEEYDVSAGFVSGNLTDYLWMDGTQVTSYVVDRLIHQTGVALFCARHFNSPEVVTAGQLRQAVPKW